jgi:purine-binding chemotaxis protein CheW
MASSESAAGKYLTFALADEEYGLPVLRVREIIRVMDITALPQMPVHVKGVINLRGTVVPVIDLRLKFGLDARERTDRTCIIVVQAKAASGRVLLGIVVDHVADVLSITADEIEPMPDFGERIDTRYILGIAKIKGTVKMLLDLDRALSVDGDYLAA